MPTYKVEAPKKQPEVVKKAQLVRIKAESTKLVPDIVARASDLVIITEEDYAQVDADLQRLTGAEKKITLKFRGTAKLPGPITTIRAGLDQLYALERELMNPLKEARVIVTRKMADWKLEERRQIQAVEDAQLRAQALLRQQAEEAERKAAEASNARTRVALESKAAQLLEKADAVAEEVPLETKVVGSTDRFVVKVRVTDIKLLAKGVGMGLIPTEVLTLVQSALSKLLKDDEETVRAWSDYGVEVYDDAIIVRK